MPQMAHSLTERVRSVIRLTYVVIRTLRAEEIEYTGVYVYPLCSEGPSEERGQALETALQVNLCNSHLALNALHAMHMLCFAIGRGASHLTEPSVSIVGTSDTIAEHGTWLTWT